MSGGLWGETTYTEKRPRAVPNTCPWGKGAGHLPGGGTPIIGHLQVYDIASGLVHNEVILRLVVIANLIGPAAEASLAAVRRSNGVSHLGGQGGTNCADEGEGVTCLQHTAGAHPGQMDKQVNLFAFESEEGAATRPPAIALKRRKGTRAYGIVIRY